MKTTFFAADPDGTQREVFAVHLRGGVLIVTGDADAARRLGIPTDPIGHPAPAADPRSDPEAYLRALPFAYGGSMLRAQWTE
jgi:hypothetical protein